MTQVVEQIESQIIQCAASVSEQPIIIVSSIKPEVFAWNHINGLASGRCPVYRPCFSSKPIGKRRETPALNTLPNILGIHVMFFCMNGTPIAPSIRVRTRQKEPELGKTTGM
jgi:hypothetical protein